MLITKSDFILAQRSPRSLWLNKFAPYLAPEPEAVTVEMIAGRSLLPVAHQLFNNPIYINQSHSYLERIEESQVALETGRPVINCAFGNSNVYTRTDISQLNQDGGLNISSVKYTSEPDERHILDLSFQAYAASLNGKRLAKAEVIHPDKFYVHREVTVPELLFLRTDLTQSVSDSLLLVPDKIDEITNLLSLDTAPAPQIEDYPHLTKGEISKFLPETTKEGSIFHLYRMRTTEKVNLFRSGIKNSSELNPEDLTERQAIQRRAEITNKTSLNADKISTFIQSIPTPALFIDFETLVHPVPNLNGVTPFQPVPFQFSAVIVDGPGKYRTHSFLADHTTKDPRDEFQHRVSFLTDQCKSVVTFNASFEKRVVEALPPAPGWDQTKNAFKKQSVDLLEPFRAFDYYNPKQKGSASIKSLMKSVFGTHIYGDLPIANGSNASMTFHQLTNNLIASDLVPTVRTNLKKYCNVDTGSMVLLAGHLEEISGVPSSARRFRGFDLTEFDNPATQIHIPARTPATHESGPPSIQHIASLPSVENLAVTTNGSKESSKKIGF